MIKQFLIWLLEEIGVHNPQRPPLMTVNPWYDPILKTRREDIFRDIRIEREREVWYTRLGGYSGPRLTSVAGTDTTVSAVCECAPPYLTLTNMCYKCGKRVDCSRFSAHCYYSLGFCIRCGRPV